MATTNMTLVERYIAAVKFWLPAAVRDDVAAELLEDIRSEIEEAETQKGRPLSEDEVAAILKARGYPMLVAAGYQPQRRLIGPELFPLYLFVLKIVAAICLIPPLLAGISLLFIDSHAPVPEMISSPFNSLLTAFAIVTIVFAVIEHKGIDITRKKDWNPKMLRPVVDPNRIARADSIANIIGPLIGIGFFAAGYLSKTTYYFPGATITVAPEWIAFWQIIIAFAVVEIAMATVNLLRPYWTGPRIVARLVIDLGQTAAFYWLVQSHVVRDLTGVPDRVAMELKTASDTSAEYAAPVLGVFAAILVAKALWRILRTLKSHPAAV